MEINYRTLEIAFQHIKLQYLALSNDVPVLREDVAHYEYQTLIAEEKIKFLQNQLETVTAFENTENQFNTLDNLRGKLLLNAHSKVSLLKYMYFSSFGRLRIYNMSC